MIRLLVLLFIPFLMGAGQFVPEAVDVATDTSNFTKNLSASDNTVQKALNTLDQLVSGGGSINWSDPTNITGVKTIAGWQDDGSVVHTVTSTDNVGIGTTAPLAHLQVGHGAPSMTLTTALGSTDALIKGRLEVDGAVYTNGNIGIGTSTANYGIDARVENLYLRGATYRYLYGTLGKLMTGSASTPGSQFSVAGNLSVGNSYSIIAAPTNGAIIEGNVGIGTTSPSSFFEVGVQKFNITSAGNVGIGTTVPLSSLDISSANVFPQGATYGNLNIYANGAQAINKGGSITLGGYNDNAATNVRVFASMEGRKANGTTGVSSGYLSFKTNQAGTLTEVMRLNESGNVGIGTTSPSSKLELVGIGTTSATKALSVKDNALTELFSIQDNGNVGIGLGTTSTSAKLTVGSPTATVPQLLVQGGQGGVGIISLKRTSGANIQFDWALTGGGLAFNDVTNGTVVLNLFGNAAADAYLGQRLAGSVTPRPSLLSSTTYATGAGTNLAGNSLTLQGGSGTGAGLGGDIILKTFDSVSTGTTAQTSTAKVTVMANGNMGIGTTVPTQILHIVSPVDTYIRMQRTGANPSDWRYGAGYNGGNGDWWLDQGTIGTTKLLVNASGNVGIGTTAPLAHLQVGHGNPSMSLTTPLGSTDALIKGRLEVDGNIYANANIGIGTSTPLGQLHVSNLDSSAKMILHRAGNNLTPQMELGRIQFALNFNGVLENWGHIALQTTDLASRTALLFNVKSTTGQVLEGMRIRGRSEGVSVGIGSASPTAKLEVLGIGATSATTSLMIRDSAGSAKMVVLDDGNVGIGSITPDSKLDVTGGAARILVGDSTPNVGYATTPGSLYIQNDLEIDGNVYLGDTITDNLVVAGAMTLAGTVNYTGNVGINSASPAAQLNIKDNDTVPFQITNTTAGDMLTVTSAGNVGIGTTAPLAHLQVGHGSPSMTLTTALGANDALIKGRLEVDSNIYVNGNVGIGTTSPAYALDVNGTVKATSLFEGANRVGMTLVSTATPSAVSSFSFSSLSTSNEYLLVLNLTQNTSNGLVGVTFNSDTGTNYFWNQLYGGGSGASSTSTATWYWMNSQTAISLSGGSTLAVGYPLFANFHFKTNQNNSNYVSFLDQHYTYLANGNYYNYSMAGQYTGSAGLSSITISTSAGTMTGTAKLYQLN